MKNKIELTDEQKQVVALARATIIKRYRLNGEMKSVVNHSNHRTVEVGSDEYKIWLKLVELGAAKGGSPESKTQIRRMKLDPNKNWVYFWSHYSE